ncbi:MAG: MaoC family dehydratase [Hyphomicrobiales bacterium]|nr:MaoC family dehydratase [Hyphomicrobiales bacterium]
MLFYEDLPGESTMEFGSHDVTRDELIAFAREFDPQPMHVDPEWPGGLIASGWFTTGLLMRLTVEGFVNGIASMGSPGVERCDWLAPVKPGDVLRAHARIAGKRPSKSRPDIGLFGMENGLTNQRGTPVIAMRGTMIVRRRGDGA